MISPLPPALIYFAGALLLPLLRFRRLQQAIALLVPVIAFIDLWYLSTGVHWRWRFLGHELIWGRVDRLSLVFATIFVIASFIGIVYALHLREMGQHTAAYLYVGSALGVVFAGDWFSLFLFWEAMAAASVFLIWYQKTERSLTAGFRYLLVHIAGGGFLLAGILLQFDATGSLAFDALDIGTWGAKFILVGFLVNAAVPPLHAWLADAYPEATITGGVFLTAFTTKCAVYVLARSFAGVEILVWLGAIMALYGVVYAVLENDIRRLLAYHIISQVGYMVCGVGLGSQLALNGASAHAFCHILYKAVLFMGMGAVIHVTGRRKLTELQGRGLFRQMPITLTLYMVGAFSISAVPLFNGFVSKTMVVAAAGELDRPFIELMLHLASVGTFLHTGLKLPWGTWFGKPRGDEDEIPNVSEPPLNMLLAMGLGSLLCLLTGIFPGLLYGLLPYGVDFHPYAAYRIIGMLQLLGLTLVAFWLYIDRLGGEPFLSLDTDWFYRRPALALDRFGKGGLVAIRTAMQQAVAGVILRAYRFGRDPYGIIRPFESPIKRALYLTDGERSVTEVSRDTHRVPVGLGACAGLLLLCGLIRLELFTRQ